MTQAEALQLIHRISISRNNPSISHLLFADDLLIFREVTIRELRIIKGLLYQFLRMSGQVINLDKTSITFCTNCNKDLKREIKDFMQVQDMNPSDPYLGAIVMGHQHQWIANQDLLEKVFNRLMGWKSKLLSHTGRMVLIKSTLASICTYRVSTVKLPKKYCDELDRI